MAFFELLAKIGADTTGFRVGIKQAESAAEKFGDTVTHHIKGKLAAAFGVYALEEFSRKAIDHAAKIRDGSAALGISTEKYQELEFAAKQSGSTIEDVAAAIRHVAKAQANALADPRGDIAQSFTRAGIALETLKSKNYEQLFSLISDRVKSGGMSMSDALAIMGRNASSVLPMMIEGFQELANEAKVAGAIMSDSTINALGDIQDELDKMSTVFMTRFSGVLQMITSGTRSVYQSMAKGLDAATTYYYVKLTGGSEEDAVGAMREQYKETQAEFDKLDADKTERMKRRTEISKKLLQIPDIVPKDDSASLKSEKLNVTALQRIGAQGGEGQSISSTLREQLTVQKHIGSGIDKLNSKTSGEDYP